MISSIFEESDLNLDLSNAFWSVPATNSGLDISVNQLFKSDLSFFSSSFKLKTRTMILTSTHLYRCSKYTEAVKFATSISWKLVEPFVEESADDCRHGFRLGHNSCYLDFYVFDSFHLDKWLESLAGVSIMTDIEQDFATIKVLGKGNYATVYMAQDLRNKEKFAVKIIDKQNLKHIPKGISSLISEIDVMRQISHSWIIKLYRVYESDDFVQLVLEYVEGGDLFHRVVKRTRFSEFIACKLAINVLEALVYLHKNSIIHRDLKLENLLLVDSENDFMIKICDFGLACFASNTDAARCGSPGYVAPEILYKEPYSCKADMFSLGIILFTLLSGQAPFYGGNIAEILVKNKYCKVKFNEKPWKDVSENAIDLVKRLTEKDPAKRISAEEALRHPWFYDRGKLISVSTSTPTTSVIRPHSFENCTSLSIIKNKQQGKDKSETRICKNPEEVTKKVLRCLSKD